jgi:hypothetical protein
MYNDMRYDKSQGRRYVEILVMETGIWRRDAFYKLKLGDIFKVYEANGTQIGTIYEAIEDAYFDNGVCHTSYVDFDPEDYEE